MTRQRLGILGGSFNPVHVGHLRLAVEALECLGLDRVDLVPSAQPPHKVGGGLLPFEVRVALLRQAVEGVAGLAVSEIEGVMPGPSYTFRTLTEYGSLVPEAQVYFLVGARDLPMLPSWHRGLELVGLANLAVAARQGEGREAVARLVACHYPEARPLAQADTDGPDAPLGGWSVPGAGEIVFFDIPRLDVSSSLVRERWLAGRSLAGLVPDGVLRGVLRLAEDVERCWSAGSCPP